MNHSNSTERQRGAALVIGLILLMVITILAMSGMNTATTELALARNDQSLENAFQAAETGLAIALSQPSFPTGTPLTFSEDLNSNDRVDVAVNFEQETIVTDRAFSLGVGGGISAYHFVAQADATSERAGIGATTDRDAAVSHSQAFYIIGPQGNSL